MKIAFGIGTFVIGVFMLLMSDYAQQDKYREGYQDCDRYHVLNHGKNCPPV